MFIFGKFKFVTAYFKNGLLYKVKPDIGDLYENRDKYYDSRFIVLNGKKYDIEDEDSIRSIVTPTFDVFSNTSLGVTGNLVYVLRMKASILRDKGEIDTALTLLKKATEMMPVSNVGWTKKDYLRFADWLYEIGEPKEADKAVKCIDELFLQFDAESEAKTLQNARELDTDLVEATYFFGCCSECAKYRGRVFSISGKDGTFPKKPTINNCTCVGLDFHPFIYGISKPTVNMYLNKQVDIVAFSNRPFVDDRTDEEKENV